jgi:hypothetical protein
LNYAQDDGGSKFMQFGPGGILLFYDHEERIALLTFDYT